MASHKFLIWIYCFMCLCAEFRESQAQQSESIARSSAKQWKKDNALRLTDSIEYLIARDWSPMQHDKRSSLPTLKNKRMAISSQKGDHCIDTDLPKINTLEEYLSGIVFETDGMLKVRGQGQVTIKVSFLVHVGFVWVLTHARAGTIFTRGETEADSSANYTWLKMTSNELWVYDIHLRVTTPVGILFIYLDKNALNKAGKMKMKSKGPISAVPCEVKIYKGGRVTYITAKPQKLSLFSYSRASQGVTDIFTYADINALIPTLKEEPVYAKIKPNMKPSLVINAAGKTVSGKTVTVVLQFSPKARRYRGTLTIPASNIDFSVVTGKRYVDHITVQNVIQATPSDSSKSHVCGVVFDDFKMDTTTSRSLAYVTHGSIDCAAAGSHRPDVRIQRKGNDIDTFEMDDGGVKKRVVHQLDGKSIVEAQGEYTCVATCGPVTITRKLVVKSLNGELIAWAKS